MEEIEEKLKAYDGLCQCFDEAAQDYLNEIDSCEHHVQATIHEMMSSLKSYCQTIVEAKDQNAMEIQPRFEILRDYTQKMILISKILSEFSNNVSVSFNQTRNGHTNHNSK